MIFILVSLIFYPGLALTAARGEMILLPVRTYVRSSTRYMYVHAHSCQLRKRGYGGEQNGGECSDAVKTLVDEVRSFLSQYAARLPTASTEPVFTPQHQHVHNFSPSPEDLTPFVMQQDTLTVSSDQDSNQSHPLPGFTAIPTSNFQWGDKDGEYLTQKLDQCYKEVVHWRRNLFKIPSGKAGTSFVREVSRMFQAYAESSALEGIAMKAAMILPALLLQKPHSRSRTKEHVKHLECRLSLWKGGNLDSLLEEGQTIQSRLSRECNSQKIHDGRQSEGGTPTDC